MEVIRSVNNEVKRSAAFKENVLFQGTHLSILLLTKSVLFRAFAAVFHIAFFAPKHKRKIYKDTTNHINTQCSELYI